MIPPHLHQQIDQQVKDTQEQAALCASLPPVELAETKLATLSTTCQSYAQQIELAVDIIDGKEPGIDWSDMLKPELLRKLSEHFAAWRHKPSARGQITDLRAENAAMREAVKEAHVALEAYNRAGIGNSSDAIQQVAAFNLSKSALSKLAPFIK